MSDSAHPQISMALKFPWDNQKMRARQNICDLRTTGWRRSQLAAALATKN